MALDVTSQLLPRLHACILGSTLLNVMDSHPLKLQILNKPSLLQVALVMVSYSSNRKVTKIEFDTRKWVVAVTDLPCCLEKVCGRLRLSTRKVVELLTELHGPP